jgi:hypothetical protein
MTRCHSAAATALAFLIACNHQPTDDTAQPGGDPSAGDPTVGDTGSGADPSHPGSGSDAGPPAPSCPLGTAAWAHAIGFASPDQRSDLAVDAAGNVLFATMATQSGGADGLTKLSPSGDVLFTRPFGTVVAADRAGNAYIAGSFTAPLDVGLGAMQPAGNIDVFVAKLDADGHVVFARPLRLCGDGVQSIAVDATGRIAVSGTAMGTAVLAPSGDLQFVLALSGDVAFDSHGDLVVAGSFTTTVDLGDGPISAGAGNREGFVIEVDRTGARLWSHLLAGSGVHTNGVAVDSKDSVVITGFYEGSIDLFGDRFNAISSSDSGRVTGAYLAKLDASGQVLWKIGRAPGSEANDVATDPSDRVVMTGASTGNAGFSRITEVTQFDAAGGGLRLFEMFPASGYGRGMAVAADACGSIYTSVNALDLPSPGSALRAYVVKVSP